MSQPTGQQQSQVAQLAKEAGAQTHRQVFAPTDIAELMNQAPWWVVSLVIHGILLVVLAAINFTGPAHRRKVVVLETPFVDVRLPEQHEVVKRNILLAIWISYYHVNTTQLGKQLQITTGRPITPTRMRMHRI